MDKLVAFPVLICALLFVFVISQSFRTEDVQQLKQDLKVNQSQNKELSEKVKFLEKDKKYFEDITNCTLDSKERLMPSSNNKSSYIILSLNRSYWKIYKNYQYRVGMNFPRSWEIFTGEDSIKQRNSIFYAIVVGKDQRGPELFDSGSIEIMLPEKITTDIETWFAKAIRDDDQYSKPKVLGWQSYGDNSFFVTQAVLYGDKRYYFKKGNTLYIINTWANGKEQKRYEEDITEMLASFKAY